MKTIATLQKESKKAPKFILCAFNPSTGGFVYISNDMKVTPDVKQAAKYSVGFDDETVKEKAFTISTGYEFMAIPA